MGKTAVQLGGGNDKAVLNGQDFVPGIVGNVWYVHHSGNATGPGVTAASAFSTLDAAIGACTANNGDVIIVLPGHAETIVAAAAIALDVAGITIIGYGNGVKRPTITYGTLASATAVISAENVTIRNLRFVSNIDDLAVFLTIGANDATVEDCDFIGASTKEVLNFIGITTTFDNAIIRRCRFIQPTDPAGTNGAAGTGAIYLVDSENVLIEGCEFRGNFETAFIHNKTSAAANLWVRNCYGICSLADSLPFVLVTTTTGGIERCSFIVPASTDIVEATTSGTPGAGFFNFQTFYGNDGGGGQLAMAVQLVAS